MNENSTGNVDALWGQPLSPEGQQVLGDAILAGRKAHPDFEALEPVMATCAQALQPDWTKILVGEFVEALYCVVRFSNFCAPIRDRLLTLTPDSFMEDEAGGTANVADILPATDQERQQRQLDTFLEARAAVLREHPDVDVFMPAMDELAKGLTMKSGEITPAHYLEALLVVTKTANFTAPLRERLFEATVPASTMRM